MFTHTDIFLKTALGTIALALTKPILKSFGDFLLMQRCKTILLGQRGRKKVI